MNNQILLRSEIRDEYQTQIQNFEKKWKRLNRQEEKYILLQDWINAFKKDLFFAGLSCLWVFVEKSLRDQLFLLDTQHNKLSKRQIDNMEQEIEDWVSSNKRWYSFNEICDKLFQLWFFPNLQECVALKNTYKIHRIPAQHGIYRRYVVDVIQDKKSKYLIKSTINSKLPIHHKANRSQFLSIIMAVGCSTILTLIDELISNFERIKIK